MMTEPQKPNYQKIFLDMARQSNKDLNEWIKLLEKGDLNSLEVMELNEKLSDGKKKENIKFKAYDKESIAKVLKFQIDHELSDRQISKLFHISRTTIAKWKKDFKNNEQDEKNS